MLRKLAKEEESRALVKNAAQLPNGNSLSGALATLSLPFIKSNADVLKYCMSPWRLPFAMIFHNQFDEAISFLENARG
jgi:hypothetical protein